VTGAAEAGKLKLSKTEKGVLLRVRAVPGASRDRISGIYSDALKVAVCAPALEGKANRAIVRVLSKTLGIKRSTISLKSGKTSRNKCFLLETLTEKEVLKMVTGVLAE
jgi:uncharacterized protein (TIGR00251 family)|tara:strand:- start:392 stop:715 length:324 start_codon:yes stop_codon:yes gene_type:complete